MTSDKNLASETQGPATKKQVDLDGEQTEDCQKDETTVETSNDQILPKQNQMETSPTKSRNRRRNEAKRRGNINKKPIQSNEQANKGIDSDINNCNQLSHFNQNEEQNPIQEDGHHATREDADQLCRNEGLSQNVVEDQYPNETAKKEAQPATPQAKIQENKNAHPSISNELENRLEKQSIKNRELEIALLKATKTCNQLERLLHQELADRSRIESENSSMEVTISRLKSQINALEKNKCNNDELIRVLNATLMERETEVSILKLKLTRLQTNTTPINSASSVSSVKHDPVRAFVAGGRSNSEFDRNSYARSSMMAEVSMRSSLSHLRGPDRDASIWATVPEELTPSKRPAQLLNHNMDSIYNDRTSSSHLVNRGLSEHQTSTPLTRDRRYRSMPRSTRGLSQSQAAANLKEHQEEPITNKSSHCQVTNLDDSNSSSQNSGNRTTISSNSIPHSTENQETRVEISKETIKSNASQPPSMKADQPDNSKRDAILSPPEPVALENTQSVGSCEAPNSKLPSRRPTSPIKLTSGIKKIFDKLRRSDSNHSSSRTDLSSPVKSPFKRGQNRSSMTGAPGDLRQAVTPLHQAINFQADKPFAEWDIDMIAHWLTVIGLSMYAGQCRRCVKVGAHIMNATPAEVDKWLGITNHLHSKKLRLAISELNGDCDKVTKAAAKLDYLWVARWLDDIGLPQHKEAFINARVDGRVLNYLTIDDLISLNVKCILHHAAIRCGIKVLRSINFDLQFLKRRATADEIECMNAIRQNMNKIGDKPSTDPSMSEIVAGNRNILPLWTCHRVMEWLRLIDFAEFASNLRGSGVHGGLIAFEPGFNIDTMCNLLSIPASRTLLRRHLSTFFNELIGDELVTEKARYKEVPTNPQLNPTVEIKTNKKSSVWLTKLKSPKVAQDTMDEYLCPMYPVEPPLIQSLIHKPDNSKARNEVQTLAKIPESINV